MAALKAAGIDSYIHYPVPVHLQTAYALLGHGPGAFPVAEDLAAAHCQPAAVPGAAVRGHRAGGGDDHGLLQLAQQYGAGFEA